MLSIESYLIEKSRFFARVKRRKNGFQGRWCKVVAEGANAPSIFGKLHHLSQVLWENQEIYKN